MIAGNEMAQIQSRVLSEIRDEIYDQSLDGGDLNDACKEALRLGVHTYVYNVYQGTVYGRRLESGGLADQNNWETTIIRIP